MFKSPIKGILLKFLHKKAVRYREYRERMTYLYTYGYGLFRPYFLHLAKLFVENGFEDRELMYPYYRVQEAGYKVDMVGPKPKLPTTASMDSELNPIFRLQRLKWMIMWR